MKESDIVYEKGAYWVSVYQYGYLVWKNCLTHSERVGTIGYTGGEGLNRAIRDIDRRLGQC